MLGSKGYCCWRRPGVSQQEHSQVETEQTGCSQIYVGALAQQPHGPDREWMKSGEVVSRLGQQNQGGNAAYWRQIRETWPE